MIDTLKIDLLLTENGFVFDDVSHIIPLLDEVVEIKSKNQMMYKGELHNLRVRLNQEKLTIEGSIPKYINGHNIDNLDWRKVNTAIHTLEQELQISLSYARISRLDIGVNIELNNPVIDYFFDLKGKPYYQRIHKHKTTLRFENNSNRRNFILYDKLKESKKSSKLIHDFESKINNYRNLMRIELQIQGRVNKYFDKNIVRVSDLKDPGFCKLILRKWFHFYKTIENSPELKYPIKNKGKTKYDEYVKMSYLLSVGWESHELFLKQLVRQKNLTSPQKSIIKRKYYELFLDVDELEINELTKELSDKIKHAFIDGLKQIFRMTPNTLSN